MEEVLDSNAEDIAALDRLNRSEQIAAERERLRDAVIEAAKKWLMEAPFMSDTALADRIQALLDFEAKQK